MEVVNTLDIDGTQWEIQDTEARNKIATIEEKTTIKITKKVDDATVKMNLVEINGEKFIQVHISGYYWSGYIGETIANFTNDFNLTEIIRGTVDLDFSDKTGRCSADIDINTDGTITVYPQFIDKFEGSYKEGYLYGDAFIKIPY